LLVIDGQKAVLATDTTVPFAEMILKKSVPDENRRGPISKIN
jgi:hypothetical protein